jgi:hypothetical protein
MSLVQTFKLHVVAATGLSKDALHIYVGFFVLLAAALLFRRSLKSIVPLIAVFVVATLGELLDALDDVSSLGHWRFGASVHDVVNTLFWPVVLCLVLRFTRLAR